LVKHTVRVSTNINEYVSNVHDLAYSIEPNVFCNPSLLQTQSNLDKRRWTVLGQTSNTEA